MNKKEIAEIKKQFTPANCTITRICGCYVDAEKNKKTKIKEAFLSLPEEEMFKYSLVLSPICAFVTQESTAFTRSSLLSIAMT